MRKIISKIDKFHQTIKGKVTFGVAELAIAYLIFLWAADSGSLLLYVSVIAFFIGGLANLLNAAKQTDVNRNGKKRTKKQ